MVETGRIRWSSPEPTAVDEELVIFDDSAALLVVRTSRSGSPVIGTFAVPVSAENRALLAGQRREVDVRHPTSEPVIMVAEVVAGAARDHPVAVATFHAAAVPGAGVALQAVGSGEYPALFELDRDSVTIHVERDGAEVAWHEHPRLESGFVSPEPAGLGGVGRPAGIAPGAYGTIALADVGLTGPGAVSVEVHGWLRDGLPEPSYRRFRVRTAPVALPDR